MNVKCSKCGGAHPSWECTKPPKKSMAALKEVQEGALLDAQVGAREKFPAQGSNPTLTTVAGTQAPPVDTKLERAAASPPKQAESDDNSKPKAARSNTIPLKRQKRNAYMRKYMANRRANKAANNPPVNSTPSQTVN